MRFSAILSAILLVGSAAALPAPSRRSDVESSDYPSYSSDKSSYSKSSYDSKDKSYEDNSYNKDNSDDKSYNDSYDDKSSDDKSYKSDTDSYNSKYESTTTYSSDSAYETSESSSSHETTTYESKSEYDSSTTEHSNTYTASSAYSMPSYGSGYQNWGGSGYDDCVKQCIANYGSPSSSWSAPESTATGSDDSYRGSKGNNGVTHTVTVAPKQGVLRFVPSNLNATVGDTVLFKWGGKVHTVTKGSAIQLCEANQDKPIDSGPQETGFEYTVAVNDTDALYYYCATPTHCSKGMFGMINAPSAFNTPSSANQMIALAAANSSDVSAMLSYLQTLATPDNANALKWGDSISMEGLEDWAKPMAVENILFTRAVLAMNPTALKEDGTIDMSVVDKMPEDISTVTQNAAVNPAANPPAANPPASSPDVSPTSADSSAPSVTPNGAASTVASSALFGAVAIAAVVLAF